MIYSNYHTLVWQNLSHPKLAARARNSFEQFPATNSPDVYQVHSWRYFNVAPSNVDSVIFQRLSKITGVLKNRCSPAKDICIRNVRYVFGVKDLDSMGFWSQGGKLGRRSPRGNVKAPTRFVSVFPVNRTWPTVSRISRLMGHSEVSKKEREVSRSGKSWISLRSSFSGCFSTKTWLANDIQNVQEENL